jgi:hypothetical protein
MMRTQMASLARLSMALRSSAVGIEYGRPTPDLSSDAPHKRTVTLHFGDAANDQS